MRISLPKNCRRCRTQLSRCLRALREESGQDLIEYALLSAVLSVAFIASIQALAGGVIPFFDRVIAALQAQ